MPREQDPIEKDESLGSVVKVQEVIDFIVLSDLQKNGRLYQSQLERNIITILEGVGVNKAYLVQRLRKLAEAGHLWREWDTDRRYNRYYEITDEGLNYFKKMMKDLPVRVQRAQRVYKLFDDLIGQYNKMDLK